MTHDPTTRTILEATYTRLREQLAGKEVTAERLRTAALEALAKVRADAALDPNWVSQELDRLRSDKPDAEG